MPDSGALSSTGPGYDRLSKERPDLAFNFVGDRTYVPQDIGLPDSDDRPAQVSQLIRTCLVTPLVGFNLGDPTSKEIGVDFFSAAFEDFRVKSR